jgi:hypothetical protein
VKDAFTVEEMIIEYCELDTEFGWMLKWYWLEDAETTPIMKWVNIYEGLEELLLTEISKLNALFTVISLTPVLMWKILIVSTFEKMSFPE